MCKRFIQLMILVTLFAHKPAQAYETDKMAHLGISYTINTMSYGLFKKMFHFTDDNKFEALLLSTVFTACIGIMKEAHDAVEGGRFDERDMLYNGIGIGLSVGTVITFDF